MTDPDRVLNAYLERLLRGEGTPDEILQHLEPLSPRELTALLPSLFTTGTSHREALRDTIGAILYRKLVESLIENVKALDASATRLARVGWWITVVVGVAGILVSMALTWSAL
jgi:hypothetical protein